MPVSQEDYCVQMGAEIKTGAFWRDIFSELLATFLLVAVQIFLLQDWQETPNPAAFGLKVALGMAFVVSAVGYGLGDFGGAHMNPAVTMAMLIRGEIYLLKGILYWVVQVGGGIAAAFFVAVVTPEAKVGTLGNTVPAPGVEWWQAVVIEALITTMVCLAALGTSSVHRKGYIILGSIPVGFAIGLGLFIALSSTGGSMNPARSVGPAVAVTVLTGDSSIWALHYVYWAGPMIGALLSSIIYWIFDSVDRQGILVKGSTPSAYGSSQENSKQFNRF